MEAESETTNRNWIKQNKTKKMTLKLKYPRGFKSLAEANKALLNKRIRICANTKNHGFTIGQEVTVTYINSITTGNWYLTCIGDNGMSYHVYPHEVTCNPLTAEEIFQKNLEICEEISKLEAEKSSNSLKIKFMKDNNLEEYDENVFKAYAVLQTIGKKSTDIEKAKAVAKILNG